MKRINQYIQEKLIVNNTIQNNTHNEEVLVLNKTNAGSSVFDNCYDFSLYSLVLDKLYKKYPNCNKFIFSYSESSNGKSYPVSKTFENGNLGIAKANNSRISRINNYDIFCQNFIYSSIKSKNIILELNNYYKKLLKEQLKYIMFISDNKLPYKYKFLYLFYSYKKDAIQLHLSDTDYNKLLNDGFFD